MIYGKWGSRTLLFFVVVVTGLRKLFNYVIYIILSYIYIYITCSIVRILVEG